MNLDRAAPWLVVISLVVSFVAMSAWWTSESIPLTGWASNIFILATFGLWFLTVQIGLYLLRLVNRFVDHATKPGHA